MQAIGQGGGQSDLVNALYAVLGPPGSNPPNSPNGLNLLGGDNDGANSASTTSAIHVTTPFTFDGGVPTGAVELRLHETIASTNVNLTTGLSTLPIQFQTKANVTISGSIDVELAIEILNNGSEALPARASQRFHDGSGT